jgi:GNAT superfamily N-acetyltransferase
MRVSIRSARAGEEERLRALAAVSKAHWGYDVDRVHAWAQTLEYAGKDVHVAEAGGAAGGYAVILLEGSTAVLDELWVEPGWIGQGVGSRLFRFVAAHATDLGATRMEWEADPNAVGFYERMGGRYLRDGGPSEWGRILPVMGIDL